MNPQNIHSVTSLNRYLKTVFEQDQTLQSLFLRGEISNFKHHFSGHFYFTLKDKDSRISAVMFAMNAHNLNFEPKDGDEVLVYGAVSIYPSQGTYQIYVYEMELFGLGKQLIDLEKLKKKLFAEGLFADERKKPLKKFPQAIGLITAKNSAALKDMTTNLIRRYPLAEIMVFPSLVQGENAAKNLVDNLKNAFTYNLDTIIIGRGGGANEDLSAFNDEELVRIIASSPIPVISAVGHEIDITLTDYVADKRASTPTGACEIAVPDLQEILLTLDHYHARMEKMMIYQVETIKKSIANCKNRPCFKNPAELYQQKNSELSKINIQLQLLIKKHISSFKEKLQRLQIRLPHSMDLQMQYYQGIIHEKRLTLSALNPQSVLARGYSFMANENGQIITSVLQINNNELVKTTLKDGIILSKVLEKEKK